MKPDRVAVDLLREGEGGFLKGDSAFKASFADLRRHGACLLAGSQAAVRAVLEDLAPARLEAGVKRQPLTLTSRFETAWRTFEARHAELAGEDNATGQKRIERAFREGYEMQLGALSATGDEP
jgi:predicted component of type VI protein secretion system